MKNIPKMKLNNKGASLIAVLIAIVVVGVMGSVVMQLTITNLQMKEVERQSKTNFYSAEDFMGYLTSQINVKSGQLLQEAFDDMLAMYNSASTSGETSMKQKFYKAYLDKMIDSFGATSPAPNQKKVDEKVVYEVGYYALNKVTDLIYNPKDGSGIDTTVPAELADLASDKYSFSFTLRSGSTDLGEDCFYYADYDKGTFTLSNVCVQAKDDFGTLTKIKTDLVFHTPDIDLENGNLKKEFMGYSLIADNQIVVMAHTKATVNGSVYAGKNGIYGQTDSIAEFIGQKVVTRGDIVADSSSDDDHYLQIGDTGSTNHTQIWARNLRTKDGSNGAKLIVSGQSYISDDLSVDGDNSMVVLNGSYYGYNYQENYAEEKAPNDSAFSSAIIINGKNAFVEMFNLESLMVNGRAYIGKNEYASVKNEVMTGEAISVKANQFVYYVPKDCVTKDAAGNLSLNYEDYAKYTGMSVNEIKQYVNGVTEYHYRLTSKAAKDETSYYLKFKNEQCANAFYGNYFNRVEKKPSLTAKAESYISNANDKKATVTMADGSTKEITLYSLQFSGTKALGGDYISRDSDGNIVTTKVTISDRYSKDNMYFNQARENAKRYKSLVLYMEEQPSKITDDNVRFYEKDEKMPEGATAVSTMYEYLIDSEKWGDFFEKYKEQVQKEDPFNKKFEISWKENETDPPSGIILAVVDNETKTYDIPTSLDGVGVIGGLVIASGDISVPSQFKGLIISGGTITLQNAWITVASDDVLISKMFTDDMMLSEPVFSKLFHEFGEGIEDVMNGSSIEKYMTYENWTKTQE